MKHQRIYEKENCSKTGPHPCHQGNPTNVPLPKIKNTEQKIPMYAIDQQWLYNHPDSKRPTRFQDWKGDGQDADNKSEEDQSGEELYV